MPLDANPLIVCGVDDSPTAAAAARWAAALVARTQGELVLLRAYRRPPVSAAYLQSQAASDAASITTLRTQVEATESAHLAAVADGLGGEPPRTMTAEGDAAAELLATARNLAADCIIVGRDRGSLGAAVLGSVSRDVIRGWDGPVLVIPGDTIAPPESGVVLAGLDPEHDARQVAADAASFAMALGASLVLAHIAPDPPLLTSLAAVGSADRLRRLSQDDEEHRWLLDLAQELKQSNGNVEAVVRFGHPERDLPVLAEDWSVAATVVGSRRRGTVRSAVLGSTSAALLAAAKSPVLIASPT